MHILTTNDDLLATTGITVDSREMAKIADTPVLAPAPAWNPAAGSKPLQQWLEQP